MKNLFLLMVGLFLPTLFLQAQNDYFFPTGNSFNNEIPSPAEYLGYDIGEWHTRHDRLVGYLQKLAEVSENATFQVIGQTNEQRPQVVLTISSKSNLERLEEIRQAHLKIADPDGEIADWSDEPVIVLLGYNVHGNEPSGGEASMLAAYYLLASQKEETKSFLENAVIMIDPVYNPDGRDRHSHWANMHKGQPPVADPLDREHNEVWPGGRTNHFWFDLNRDWLPLAQVESRNRMAFYHKWLPNVATDYHEMGTNATYFYEPTKPFGSENPLVPRRNYDELNQLFADYFEEALNDIGSLYYSKESFDNSYPGYGSTYPDMQGGLGLLFEQASSRGHLQRTHTKDLSFDFTIRNQLRTSIATVRASVENRTLLLDYQRWFFESAIKEANNRKTKAYIFGAPNDASRNKAFQNLLQQHHIEFQPLAKSVEHKGRKYSTDNYFVVPAVQPQHLLVRTFFEPVESFHDSVFYDASAWTVALAFDMDYEALPFLPATTSAKNGPVKSVFQKAEYAYLIEWSDYAAPKVLHFLQNKKVLVKTAFQPFEIKVGEVEKQFGYGTLLVHVADQNIEADELHRIMSAAFEMGVPIHPIATGRSISGVDMGSRHLQTLKPPKVLMPIGEGVSGYEVGEVWHLLDTRLSMPITKVDLVDFRKVNLYDYNTLLLVSGRYDFDEKTIREIKDWISAGNTLITQRTATKWAIDKGLADEEIKKRKNSEMKRMDFSTAANVRGSKRIGGSVYEVDLDITHPLGFGYTDRSLPVYRNHSIFVEPSESAFNTVAQYTDAPHLDGYISAENLETLKGTASLLVNKVGQGRAILFVDNPNFRGFWYGTNRLFFNSLFLGGLVR